MSGDIDIEQGEDPGIPPSAVLAPDADTVTLTRPLCVDGELSLTESETRTGRLA